MLLAEAVKRLEHADAVCSSPDSTASDIRTALAATTELQGFIDARRAELIRSLNEIPTAFAEATISETTGCSLGQAAQETERAATLAEAFEMAEALGDGRITAGHVDALTRGARRLDQGGRDSLLGDTELADAAARCSIAQFDALVKKRSKALDRSDAEAKYARQCRATTLSTFTDADGMWNLRGKFDPLTGSKLAKQIRAATTAKFAEATPDTAPSNPMERTRHLEGLALAGIILDERTATTTRPGPPMVVIDASQTDGTGGPVIDWGITVEVPAAVLADIFDVSDPDVVIVSNGVVLHAEGRLDLGRSSRLANRAQRRALAGLYSTCAVPNCGTHIDRCRLHHVRHWEHGGCTDIANLLPICQHHHTLLHEKSWNVTLGSNRELTIELPDGQTMRTGPPRRGAP
jgi:hypothetical protein